MRHILKHSRFRGTHDIGSENVLTVQQGWAIYRRNHRDFNIEQVLQDFLALPKSLIPLTRIRHISQTIKVNLNIGAVVLLSGMGFRKTASVELPDGKRLFRVITPTLVVSSASIGRSLQLL